MITSRKMRWAGHLACMGALRNKYKILVGKLEGRTQLGRHECKWEDKIRMYLNKIRWGGCGLDSAGSQ
jgi:hypothetical protein